MFLVELCDISNFGLTKPSKYRASIADAFILQRQLMAEQCVMTDEMSHYLFTH